MKRRFNDATLVVNGLNALRGFDEAFTFYGSSKCFDFPESGNISTRLSIFGLFEMNIAALI